jgi:hypothetical protein
MIARLTTAAELVLAEPGSWLVSAAGFLARGGVVLFAAALLQLPSPITLTLVFGVDSVTATGDPTARLITTVAILILLGVLAVVAMLLIAAWTDVVSVARVWSKAGAASDASAGPAREVPDRRRRGWARAASDVLAISWLQSLGILPGLLALALVAPMLRDVAVGELLLPTSLSVPFLVRVASDVAGPLARALVILAVSELLVTMATRQYLAATGVRSSLRAYGQALAQIVRQPLSVMATWLVGWLVLIGAMLFALSAVSLAWNEVRAVFLDVDFRPPPAPATGAPFPLVAGIPVDALAGALGAAVLLALVWISAIALIGMASAFRSTLWTLTVARQSTEQVGVAWPADAHA